MGKEQSKQSGPRASRFINRSGKAEGGIPRTFFIFGIDSGGVEKFLEFDPGTQTFKSRPPPKKMKVFNYMAAVCVGDVVYMSGGINKELNSIQKLCYCFHIVSDDFEKLPDMNQLRYTHMTTVKDDKLFVFGGRTYGYGEAGILNHCEYLDLRLKRWLVISPMRKKRCTGFTFQYKNDIYVTGGYTGDKKRSKKIECYPSAEQTNHLQL